MKDADVNQPNRWHHPACAAVVPAGSEMQVPYQAAGQFPEVAGIDEGEL